MAQTRPKIDPGKYSELIFDEGAETIEWTKNGPFNK